MVKLLVGPFAALFVVLLYTASMSSMFGYGWVASKSNVANEYVIILVVYYVICLLGPIDRFLAKLLTIYTE